MSQKSTPPAMVITGLFRDRQAAKRTFETKKLNIGDQPIKFFCDAILQGTQFEQLLSSKTDLDVEIWHLRFFVGSRFEHSMYVVRKFYDFDALPERNDLFRNLTKTLDVAHGAGELLDVGRMIWLNQETATEQNVAVVSQFMRGSFSLKAADFSDRSGRTISVDARGLAMIASGHVADIHARHTLLLALARAYQFAADAANSELAAFASLAPSTGVSEQLAALHRDTLVFAARFWFARPVNLQTVDLRHIWEDLSHSNHLQDAHAELNEQLTAMLALLQTEQQRREQASEQRNQRWLSLIGLLLTVLSLLSLVSITPESLREFWRAWFTH